MNGMVSRGYSQQMVWTAGQSPNESRCAKLKA